MLLNTGNFIKITHNLLLGTHGNPDGYTGGTIFTNPEYEECTEFTEASKEFAENDMIHIDNPDTDITLHNVFD